MRRAASWARKAVATPTSSMLTRLRAGAFALALSSSASNSGMPEAARVASGPGEMACTRMPFGPSSAADIADRAFERRLGDAHDVIVLNDHLAAVVGHREERAAFAHQRLRQMRHANEGPTGHLHGGEKTLPRDVDDAPLQRLFRRERDGMHDEIELAPILGDAFEHRFHLARRAHVERHQNRSFELAGER